jgi:hypothetical protein
MVGEVDSSDSSGSYMYGSLVRRWFFHNFAQPRCPGRAADRK